ncbi:MAG: hypothetical protein WDM92_03770 [Caulobacteraceae bacterium]
MIQAEVKHPSALSPAEIAAWRGFCAADPALQSPLLGPDFARLVGEVRCDARVAVYAREGADRRLPAVPPARRRLRPADRISLLRLPRPWSPRLGSGSP